MPSFLQAVILPERCFLSEALLWIAFQRLPLSEFTFDGIQIRDSTENNGYEPAPFDRMLFLEETTRAGIPTDPRFVSATDKGTNPHDRYNELADKHGHDEALRIVQEVQRESDQRFERDCVTWEPYYQTAVEYPASQIFVALKSGRIHATCRLLPCMDPLEALAKLDGDDVQVPDLPPQKIQPSFWSLNRMLKKPIGGSDFY